MKTGYTASIDEHGHGHMVVYEDGEIWEVTSSDPGFPLFVLAAKDGKTLAQIKASSAFTVKIEKLSDRMTITNDNLIEFDGVEVNSEVARTIARYAQEGRPNEGLVKFMERLADNTTETSRNELYKWIERVGLEIDEEGYVIGYRGLRDDFTSVHAGGAYVDGSWVSGHVPNVPGSVVSMDRDEVDADPDSDCSHGLHVGSLSYAEGWSRGRLVVVKVDPADVVSVPSSGTNKMRTCKYEVIDVVKRDSYEPEPNRPAQLDTTQQDLADAVKHKGIVKRLFEQLRTSSGYTARKE